MSRWGFDRWGFDPWGDGPPDIEISITVSAVTPSIISSEGGFELTFDGQFTIGQAYYLYLGPLGSQLDTPLYSGHPTRSYRLYSTDGVTLSAIAPPLTVGNPILTLVKNSTVETFNGLLTVVPRLWPTKRFSLKRRFQPIYALGARRLSDEDPG